MKDFLKGTVYAGIFAVPFVVLLVSGSLFFPYITGKNFAFRIIVEIITIAWFLLALHDSRYRPKFSWVMASIGALLVVMFFANLLGEYPPKSFWGNYERMEGYVTLVHFFLYFIVVGTMLREAKHWTWFFNTTLGVALVVSLYGLAQFAGAVRISQGGEWRVDATLGNSTYMAVYMLFHIAIAALMLIRARSNGLRYFYAGLIAFFVFLLLQTGTRGTTLGLLGGSVLGVFYIALLSNRGTLRRIAMSALVVCMVIVGGFIAIRDTSFIQNTPALARIANISLEEGEIRFIIWDIALQGFKEHPVLGWGQENFSYVYNKYYHPELYRAEAWYDRVHNVALDWLIAGGIIGALCYFAITVSALYYTNIKPAVTRLRKGKMDEEDFPLLEQGLIFGLLAAYTFHNLLVFDNIVSYIFFAVILAYIHSRYATTIPWLAQFKVDRKTIGNIVTPIAGVALILIVYFVNIPGMRAAADIIAAYRATDYDQRFAAFERALERNSFADQEIVEQYSEQVTMLAARTDAPKELKDKYVLAGEEILKNMIAEKPGDPRFHVFLAGLYRNSGQFEKAAQELETTRALTPNKASVIIEQGIIALQLEEYDLMYEFFKTIYDIAPGHERGRVMYASALMFRNETDRLGEVIPEENMRAFVQNSITHFSIQTNGAMPAVSEYFNSFIATHPESIIARASFAELNYALGRTNEATQILESAIRDIPSFKEQGECYLENVEDKDPFLEECVPY